MPSESMERLRELTSLLPAFPAATEEAAGFKIHEMSCGTSISWSLLNQAEISVARWFNSSGTQFPTHVHEGREWVIVYVGSMYLTICGEEEVRLLPGQSIMIEPGMPHAKRFPEDCWYLACIIPRSSDWPK